MSLSVLEDNYIYYVYVNARKEFKCLFEMDRTIETKWSEDIQTKESIAHVVNNVKSEAENTQHMTIQVGKDGKVLFVMFSNDAEFDPSCKFVVSGPTDVINEVSQQAYSFGILLAHAVTNCSRDRAMTPEQW
ncbi:hypothetical protein GGI20_002558 [Coemansia sp. BCRC 34301]|nr:hypothetical protein GGI20_002558 [Coemansia sp. BCRC 34301]